jgi:hypothetical protein
MDYKLDNINLNLNEKNKKLFTEFNKTDKSEQEDGVDTFKMYTEFLQEKDGLIEIINELVQHSLNYIRENKQVNPKIKNLDQALNYKNKVIMIVIFFKPA